MGTPLHLQVISHPATSAVTVLGVVVWIWLLQRGVSPAAVGLSYHRFVAERQWWRALTAQICHFELLHLVLNISSLWGLAAVAERGPVEDSAVAGPSLGSSLEYVRVSLLLLLASAAICLALHHFAVAVGLERFRHSLVIGYSGVLFGWMTLIAWRSRGHGVRFSLLGLVSVPATAAPFMLLLVIQALLPNASFLGHLSGILAGLLLASGLLHWLNPYWTACLLFWVVVGVFYGLALEGRLGTSYVRLLPYRSEGIIEGGAAESARLEDIMERGAVVVSGPGAAAGPTTAVAAAVTALAGTARGVGTTVATVVQRLRAWASSTWPRLLGSAAAARSGPVGQRSAGGLVAAAASAAAASGPALPWGNPATAVPPTRPTAAGGSLPDHIRQ